MFVECDVRALVVHPGRPDTLYLGSELGVFVSRDGADNWSPLLAPPAGLQVWSLWLRPGPAGDILLAGTCPSDVFRSADGGRSWERCATRMERSCPRILHARVTALASDPADPDHLWAGVEIDGIHHSRDGGRTWESLDGTGLSSRDLHALAALPAGAPRPPRLLATTNNDLNVSEDGGRTWAPLSVGRVLPWPYCRALAQKCGDPEVLLLGVGDGPPGSVGAVARSTDGGASWRLADLPGRANSTVWNFAAHPADPELLYASSVSGQVYRSTDGGATWAKLAREFGEIRSLAWAPAA
jgi:photosystem II stability/assembly factor-like uncharacterized protein